MRVGRLRFVVFGKNAPHDIFVKLDAEGERDDVCDAWTPITGIALLQFGDGSDKFPGRL